MSFDVSDVTDGHVMVPKLQDYALEMTTMKSTNAQGWTENAIDADLEVEIGNTEYNVLFVSTIGNKLLSAMKRI